MDSSNTKPFRIAVFASGAGSNLSAILRWIAESGANVEIAFVLSNNSKSGALMIAKEAGINAIHHSHKRCEGNEVVFANHMLSLLRTANVDLIVLAGYMKQLPPIVVHEYSNRILNVHPALLPAFGGKDMYGRRVHEAVLSRGCKVSGATVHLVTEEYDAGPIVLQQCCSVEATDTPESLGAKIAALEHTLLPRAIGLFAEARVTVENDVAFIHE